MFVTEWRFEYQHQSKEQWCSAHERRILTNERYERECVMHDYMGLEHIQCNFVDIQSKHYFQSCHHYFGITTIPTTNHPTPECHIYDTTHIRHIKAPPRKSPNMHVF
eukprot:PhF_6_TR8629/c0_g1_i1/m.13470